MLVFENLSYNDIVHDCRCTELDYLLRINKKQISKISEEIDIPADEIGKQIRLQALFYSKSNYQGRQFLKRRIVPTLQKYINDYSKEMHQYWTLCGAELIQSVKRTPSKEVIEYCHQYRIQKESEKSCTIILPNKMLRAIIAPVDYEKGEFIEKKLHYLRSHRNDSILRMGLYLEGYEWPICYMCFCNIDREDKVKALSVSIDENIDRESVIELSRVFGCGNLPLNTISMLLGASIKYLRKHYQYEYVITAVNPTLGFDGKSMIASGFAPYALRPVKYGYNKYGLYCTARNDEVIGECPFNTPPNILYAKEITSLDSKTKCCRLISIADGYKVAQSELERYICRVRRDMERVWDEETRYHGTRFNEEVDHISKGQCGVSSLFLANILVGKKYKVLFCEGNADFPNKNNSIHNHCWIKLFNYKNFSPIIIDITADQQGYSRKIIFKTVDELQRLNIHYNATSEKDPQSVDVDHLLTRLDLLSQKLNYNSKEEGKEDE